MVFVGDCGDPSPPFMMMFKLASLSAGENTSGAFEPHPTTTVSFDCSLREPNRPENWPVTRVGTTNRAAVKAIAISCICRLRTTKRHTEEDPISTMTKVTNQADCTIRGLVRLGLVGWSTFGLVWMELYEY